jgi:putative endonuclease
VAEPVEATGILKRIIQTGKVYMPFMYILECADGSFYTGSTRNLEKRLREHLEGEGANHTKNRLPVKLVYCEEYESVRDAFFREKQVQGWSRRKKIALINGNNKNLIAFSKSYQKLEELKHVLRNE